MHSLDITELGNKFQLSWDLVYNWLATYRLRNTVRKLGFRLVHGLYFGLFGLFGVFPFGVIPLLLSLGVCHRFLLLLTGVLLVHMSFTLGIMVKLLLAEETLYGHFKCKYDDPLRQLVPPLKTHTFR